jgi:alpha-mannosidase
MTTAHIIAHSHWDREWYLPFERHRLRLVRLFETLLELFERDPDYGSFHLDGQAIVLEDYLEMMPHRADAIRRLVKAGKLIVGPWYVLQDEFLISGEANVRNLLIGIRESEAFGGCARIGYFPDSFGNIGQAPQLLRQAGIDTAVFGRGVKPVGFNNDVRGDAPHAPATGQEGGSHASKYSEMRWAAPDGSTVLAILFANWYHNGMEIPADPAEAKRYWARKLADAKAYASTSELLFMNGCDHQPPQRNLTAALAAAREAAPDVQFVQSDFASYVRAVQSRLPDDLSVVRGELRSQWTDGWFTLVNTASSRVYLKRANKACQTMLEQVAEPLAAMAYAAGAGDPRHPLRYAWKTLLRNHPHDSICGCGVDEVHREMMTRFEKAKQVAEAIAADSAQALADRTDTSAFRRFREAGGVAAPFVVFNTTGHPRSGAVTCVLELNRQYFREGEPPHEQFAAYRGWDPGPLAVVDAAGRRVEASVRKLGPGFGYELPDDRFRRPHWAYKVEVTLAARELPAFGAETFALVSAGGDATSAAAASAEAGGAAGLMKDARTMENDRLRIVVADDGSFELCDKRSGRRYPGLGVYEDTGDVGNEYVYKQPEGEAPLTTEGLPAAIETVENTPVRAVCRITRRWELPASAEPLLDEEIGAMVPFRERKARRVPDKRTVTLRTELTLEKFAGFVRVKTEIDNTVCDHRLRMLFPTGIRTDTVWADAPYEIAERPVVPGPQWQNPSNAQHMGAFVSLSDGRAGFTVAADGLHEYEALRDGRGTIAVTLLRGVREMGDWGVFPTPEAQCLGLHTAELALFAHEGDAVSAGICPAAYAFAVPWTVRQTDVHDGPLPASRRFLQWEGERLAVTALKAGEQCGDIMLRLFNLSRERSKLTVSAGGLDRAYRSTILEERGADLEADADGAFALEVGPAEIVTIGFRIASCEREEENGWRE